MTTIPKKQVREVCSLIKQLREEKRYTQYSVACELGMSQNAYCDMENGITEIKLSRLFQLAIFFKVHPTVFFENLPPP